MGVCYPGTGDCEFCRLDLCRLALLFVLLVEVSSGLVDVGLLLGFGMAVRDVTWGFMCFTSLGLRILFS